MKILVLNCGSSSIKFQVMDIHDGGGDLLAKGMVDRIGLPNSVLSLSIPGKDKYKLTADIPDHEVGVQLVLQALVNPEHGVLKSAEEIGAIGHRTVHGGELFKNSVLITDEVVQMMEKLIELAPLHNPANLKGIYATRKLMPSVPMVGVFDTSFHQTMPDYAYFYPIPFEYYEKYGIRKYGFHGTSHKFVAQKACQTLGLDIHSTKIITCHLGNGSSITAIDGGKSVDTSMGLTPLEGCMMGTRSGDVDLGVLLFIAEKENLSIPETNSVFNKKSGVCGVSGVSFDMRDVEIAAANGNTQAKLALDMYAYRVLKYVGAYAAVLNGVDLIIFTGGIGENDFDTRRKVLEKLTYLGVDFDPAVNDGVKGKEIILTRPGSKVIAMVEPTNEELIIATDTYSIVTGQSVENLT